MAAPFSNFAIPATPYLVVLGVGLVLVTAMLYALRPPITERFVPALIPWVFAGSALHVFYLLGDRFAVQIYPPVLKPFFAAPAVYVTTFIGVGAIWVGATVVGTAMGGSDAPSTYLGGTGVGVALVMFGLVVWQALDPAVGPIRPLIPIVGVIVAGVLTFVVYIMLGAWRTYVIAEARLAGGLVLFAHILDGLTTAIGVDILGGGERSLLPRVIMDVAADLPTAEYIGVGWLFLVVKMFVAIVIIVTFADYVREEPERGNVLFAAVMVVGLGPAFNNLLIYFLGV